MGDTQGFWRLLTVFGVCLFCLFLVWGAGFLKGKRTCPELIPDPCVGVGPITERYAMTVAPECRVAVLYTRKSEDEIQYELQVTCPATVFGKEKEEP